MFLTDKVLEGLQNFVVTNVDAILIYSRNNIDEHVRHIQIVLDWLRQHQVKLKMNKCRSAAHEIICLGHIINTEGISHSPQRLSVV